MLKAKKVSVRFGLNDANSLLDYLDLLRLAMNDKNSELRRAFDENLSAADWQGAARCLQPLKEAIKDAQTPKRVVA